MPYRSLLLVLFLLLCCNWAVHGEEEQEKPAKLTAESFRFDPSAKGLSIGVHIDEENGYLYALVKNAGPNDITINTFRIEHWEFWQLEIKSGKNWQLVPFADTIFKTTYGIATSAKSRKTLHPTELVTKKSERLEIPILHKADNVLVGHQHCALPSNRKANRNKPLPGATVAIDFLDLEWPSELLGDEISIRITGSIFVDDDDSDDNGYKLLKIISPVARLKVAALKKMLSPDFTVTLSQDNKPPENMDVVDVYLRNNTDAPITLKGTTSDPWNPNTWFFIEVNDKPVSAYEINIALMPGKESSISFAPKEQKKFTQIFLPALYNYEMQDGKHVRTPSMIRGKTYKIVLKGRAIHSAHSNELTMKASTYEFR